MANMLTPLDRDACDSDQYRRALSIEGYFTEGEATLLMRAIQNSGPDPRYLEIGSFRGRSTMFALAALTDRGTAVAVDAFVYAEHSPEELRTTLSDTRVSVLEGTIVRNWASLREFHPTVVLVDADHSFAGVSLDLALVVALTPIGSYIATHDVSERFPGVSLVVGALAKEGVIAQVESEGDLTLWTVEDRPGWLIDPRPEIDWQLPDEFAGETPEIVELLNGDHDG